MKILEWQMARKTFPTGDPKFAVMQAFPAGISEEDADPFLMCDFFGPTKSKGRISNPDEFEVPWHPHRGMDILTYMVEGRGRHADSMGNREEFPSPGMQWISVGSGIEHAEGGGTPAGETVTGFQIWVNVPAARKMDDPKYGTEPPESIPNLVLGDGVTARLLAGSYAEQTGPFRTVQDVQIMDYKIAANAKYTHLLSAAHDNCLLFIYDGHGKIAGTELNKFATVRMDARSPADREVSLEGGPEGMSVMIFAGKRLNEPIAWRGPFVLSTNEQLAQTMEEYRRGDFPPVRVAWDYKRIATKPKV